MIRRTRLKYEDQFTQIPNAWMRDKRLSRRARGLLAEITTHRINWRITIASLQEGGPEGREAIRTSVAELIAAGYLVRSQKRSEQGRMQEIEYELRDPTELNGTATSNVELSTEITADQEPVSGPDQDEHSATHTLSTDATAVGFTDVGSADVGSADVGKSAPIRRTSLEEDQEKKSAAGAATCSSHPHGTPQPCRGCREARLDAEAALAASAALAAADAAAARAHRFPADVYCPHLELRTNHCEACAQDARAALRDAGYATAGAP